MTMELRKLMQEAEAKNLLGKIEDTVTREEVDQQLKEMYQRILAKLEESK